MPNKFDDFIQTVGETAERIAGSAVQIAKFAGEKASYAAKIAKIHAEILAEKENVRKAYTEVGKSYVKQFGDAPHEGMAGSVKSVSASIQRIAELNTELADLKSAESSDFDDADFDDSDDDAEDARQ
ncbi:MAG: hypothetical protein LBD85_06205 [Oscillospiraceae bacterium]|jgi:hypothetical protein|nr:hypothetical protein [Oscillospiraceae bacterium]